MQYLSEMPRETKLALLAQIEEGNDYLTDYLPTLKPLLEDPDPEIRAQAIRCLWDYPETGLIDVLMDRAVHDPSQEVRSAALGTLGRYIYEGEIADYDAPRDRWSELVEEDALPREDFERVRNFLLEVHRDPTASLDSRRFALEALGFSNDPKVTRLIEAAYKQPEIPLKVSAIFAMGRQGTRRWKNIILRELDSPQPEQQYEAVRAAGEMYLTEAASRLKRLARNPRGDKDLRMAAIFALGKAGGEDVFDFLDKMANDPDKEIREVAEAALEEWHIYYGLDDMADFDDDWDDDDYLDDEDE